MMTLANQKTKLVVIIKSKIFKDIAIYSHIRGSTVADNPNIWKFLRDRQ